MVHNGIGLVVTGRLSTKGNVDQEYILTLRYVHHQAICAIDKIVNPLEGTHRISNVHGHLKILSIHALLDFGFHRRRPCVGIGVVISVDAALPICLIEVCQLPLEVLVGIQSLRPYCELLHITAVINSVIEDVLCIGPVEGTLRAVIRGVAFIHFQVVQINISPVVMDHEPVLILPSLRGHQQIELVHSLVCIQTVHRDRQCADPAPTVIIHQGTRLGHALDILDIGRTGHLNDSGGICRPDLDLGSPILVVRGGMGYQEFNLIFVLFPIAIQIVKLIVKDHVQSIDPNVIQNVIGSAAEQLCVEGQLSRIQIHLNRHSGHIASQRHTGFHSPISILHQRLLIPVIDRYQERQIIVRLDLTGQIRISRFHAYAARTHIPYVLQEDPLAGQLLLPVHIAGTQRIEHAFLCLAKPAGTEVIEMFVAVQSSGRIHIDLSGIPEDAIHILRQGQSLTLNGNHQVVEITLVILDEQDVVLLDRLVQIDCHPQIDLDPIVHKYQFACQDVAAYAVVGHGSAGDRIDLWDRSHLSGTRFHRLRP